MENENADEQARIGREVDAVEQDFGDCALVYAEVRAKAAKIRGDPHAAAHWQMVRENIRGDGSDDDQ